MRISIYWIVIGVIHAIASLAAYLVQPRGYELAAFRVVKSQHSEIAQATTQNRSQTEFAALFDVRLASSVFAPAHYGNIRITINGKQLQQLPLRAHMHISRYHSMYEANIPPNLLSASDNTIEIQRLGSMSHLSLPDVYVGPTQLLRGFGDHQEALITWVDRTTLLFASIGMMVTAILLFVSRKIAHYAYFFSMFALLVLHEFRDQVFVFGRPLMAFMTYIGLSYLLLSALSFSHWTEGQRSERRLIFLVGAGALMLTALIDFFFGIDNAATVPARSILFIFLSIALVFWIARRLFRNRRAMSPELIYVFAFASAFGLGYLIALITLFGAVDAPSRLFLVCLTNIAETLGLTGILATVAFHEIGAYRRELVNNSKLDGIVSGQVLQLDAEAQRLKSLIESRAVLEERQRFTRDIHDGIGGQLLSLLLKARSGALTSSEAEIEVARSIADLRLITAALDSSDDGLAAALRSFEQRARDQLSIAGMDLNWQLDDTFEALKLDPRVILELLRWLQEGVTNAIRHSGATQVSIQFKCSTCGGFFSLRLADNGAGFDTSKSLAGRGVGNMRTRASKLGGTFSIEHGKPGSILATALILRFPRYLSGRATNPN